MSSKLLPWAMFASAGPALVVSCGGRSGLLIDDIEDAAPPEEEASLDASRGSPHDAASEASADVSVDAPLDASLDTNVPPDVVSRDSTSNDATPEAGPDALADSGLPDATDANDEATTPDADASCPTLGASGIEQIPVPTAPYAWSQNGFAVQPDGKILVYGFPNNGSPAPTVYLARYDVDGILDATFGTAGIATLSPPLAANWPSAVAVQDDGKIVFSTLMNGGGSYVGRVSATGVLDTSFGTGGFVASQLNAHILKVAVRPDGTIVGIGDQGGDIYVTRFTSTGALDPTFGTGGVTSTPIQSSAGVNGQSVAFQADGKLVVVGRTILTETAGCAAMLLRYTANGALDTTFGTGGIVEPVNVPGQYYMINDVLVQSSGGIVAVMGADWTTDATTFTLQRFTSTGALDTSFGTNGITVTNFFSDRLVLLPGDAVMVGGTLLQQGVYTIALARYTADGVLDPSYGDGGMGMAYFPGETQNYFRGLALGPQGLVFDGQGMTSSTDGGGQPLLDLGPVMCR
jgi:uncharacterized delta-60 repeat protein